MTAHPPSDARAVITAERAAALTDALREMHSPEEPGTYLEGRCIECGHLYPCDTVRTVDDLGGDL